MNQIILINTYVGLSDFTFEVGSSGRQLTHEEVTEKGLFTTEMQRRHRNSSYAYQWYEVNPGDIFTITHLSDDVRQQTVLRVPATGMDGPNSNVDNFSATGINLKYHLACQCEMVSQENI